MESLIVVLFYAQARYKGKEEATNNDENEQPASQRVLATTELFELILLGLPIRQLLIKIPLVCKHWKATIDSSPKLQQALFFQPIPHELLQLLTLSEKPTVKAWKRSHSDPYEYTVLMNPFSYIYMRDRSEALLRPEASWRRMLVSQPLVATAEDGLALKFEQGGRDYRFPRGAIAKNILTATTLEEGVGMWKKVYFADEVGLLRQAKAWRV